MTSSHPSPDSQAGFTIIETMVASVLLLVGLVATLTVLTQASATTVKTRTREQATNLQRELVEAARSVSYDKLTQNSLGIAVRSLPGLSDSSTGSAGWTIRRRNATYSVSMGVCTVDDSSDGIGAHEANAFCAASGPSPSSTQCGSLLATTTGGTGAGVLLNFGLSAPQLAQLGQCGIDVDLDGTVDGLVSTSATFCGVGSCGASPDPNAADYKRIVSLVRWPGGSNLQTSQVDNPGAAGAPSVLILTAATPNNAVLNPDASAVSFASTTSNKPETVGLYRDGTYIGAANPAGGANWSATWDLKPVDATVGAQPKDDEVVDGSYELSEKAFDRYKQYGATKSQTILVNRRQHFAPARVDVGRNGTGTAVEVEWSPAKERDSKGFSVERLIVGGPRDGEKAVVCEIAVRTACLDTAAPAPLPGQQKLEYRVSGHDLNSAGGLRQGDGASASVEDPAPAPPGTPGSLTASRVNGEVTLTWTAPLRPAPDHYNIYRDEEGYGGRLVSVSVEPGEPLTYVDPDGGSRPYWITAVNSQLGESASRKATG